MDDDRQFYTVMGLAFLLSGIICYFAIQADVANTAAWEATGYRPIMAVHYRKVTDWAGQLGCDVSKPAMFAWEMARERSVLLTGTVEAHEVCEVSEDEVGHLFELETALREADRARRLRDDDGFPIIWIP